MSQLMGGLVDHGATKHFILLRESTTIAETQVVIWEEYGATSELETWASDKSFAQSQNVMEPLVLKEIQPVRKTLRGWVPAILEK